MKRLNSLWIIVSVMACSAMSVMAEANERPGQVAALKDLKPYLLLLDGADLSLNGDMDASPPSDPDEAAKLRALLSKEGTFLPWAEKKSRAVFKEEHSIAWSGDQRMVEVSLSLSSNEALVQVEKDSKKLRYEIGEDAKWELVKLFTDREIAAKAMIEAHKETSRAKADPVEMTDTWRKPIANGAILTVHEGLPHRGHQAYERESRRSDVQVSGGHAFYTPGVVAKHRAELARLLADASSYHRLSGPKECGGFHPDFAISWNVNRQTLTLLVCYGCHEVIFTDGKNSLRYDLDHEAGKKIEPLLKENGGKRPAE